MTYFHPRFLTLLFIALACVVVQPTGAIAEIRSYQFLPEQGRLFSFAGGLTGTDAAAQLAGSLDLAVFKTPVGLPRIEIAQFWHERFHRDPAHRWIRAITFELFAGGGQG